jgi:hypothetical protein
VAYLFLVRRFFTCHNKVRMNKNFRRKLIFSALVLVLAVPAARSGQQLDGIWVGTEKLTPSTQANCPKQNYQQSMLAKIAVAQNGSLLAVVEGYGPGRYTNLHWSGNTLVFEVANMRKGELRLSSDGKTLSETGSLRRTIDFGMRMGGTGNVLMDNAGPGGAVNGLHGSKATHVAIPTPCVDQLTGIFHREKQP